MVAEARAAAWWQTAAMSPPHAQRRPYAEHLLQSRRRPRADAALMSHSNPCAAACVHPHTCRPLLQQLELLAAREVAEAAALAACAALVEPEKARAKDLAEELDHTMVTKVNLTRIRALHAVSSAGRQGHAQCALLPSPHTQSVYSLVS
jgi:hypothetical protein